MAATVSVKESNGATPTATTITNARYNSDDNYNPGTSTPLVKPAAGTNYSFWKFHYLNADSSPSGTINNVKWYTDGAIGWSGCTLYVGVHSVYSQATGTVGTTGAIFSAASYVAASFVSAVPLSIGGSISNPSTGKITDYIVTQVGVSTSASAGTLSQETIYWRYDET